jgi:hypothetical protein
MLQNNIAYFEGLNLSFVQFDVLFYFGVSLSEAELMFWNKSILFTHFQEPLQERLLELRYNGYEAYWSVGC